MKPMIARIFSFCGGDNGPCPVREIAPGAAAQEESAMSHADLIQAYISARPPGDRASLEEEAERAVREATAKVEALRLNGDLKQLNSKYRRYRLLQVARGEPALSYSVFLERRVANLVRSAATGTIA
jgi:hypothetical protein